MGSGANDDMEHTASGGTTVIDPGDDPFALWRELQMPLDPGDAAAVVDVPVVDAPDLADVDTALASLDSPRRVLSEAYIGTDRRRPGGRATAARATYLPRRKLLRLDVLIVVSVAVMLIGTGLLVSSDGGPVRVADRTVAAGTTAPVAAPSDVVSSRPHSPTTAPAAAPVAASVAAPAVAPAATGAVATTVPSSPEAMGAAALALVRYPWQQIPGYSIVFRPITDAPSPGFYGNTSFAWGQTGGTSTLYVYPGETVDQLAAITAFEIGHEVDAAYVEPLDGHDKIAALLGVHPASWAPECDCAEQGYLSGWYAAAFSDYWSPGLGNWSSLAPAPSGSLLTAMEPWLNLPTP